MKLNDDYEPTTHNEMMDGIISLREEFKVVKNALDMEQEKNKEQTARIEKLTTQVERINTDLHLKPHSGRGDSTRKIARDAFNQSTVSANWASLEDHPVIKNLYKSIKIAGRDLTRSNESLTKRINDVQPANEVFKELEGTYIIKEIITRLDDFDSHLQILRDDTTYNKDNANKQDHRLIDRIADIQTAQDALEFIQSEKILTYDAAFIFLMGAWAKSGFEPVAEGLRIMLKRPKEEKK